MRLVLLSMLLVCLYSYGYEHTAIIRTASIEFQLSSELVFEYYMEFLKDTAWLKEHTHEVNEHTIRNAFLEWLAIHVTRSSLLNRDRYTQASGFRRTH